MEQLIRPPNFVKILLLQLANLLSTGMLELSYEWRVRPKVGAKNRKCVEKPLILKHFVKFQQKWEGSYPPDPCYNIPEV